MERKSINGKNYFNEESFKEMIKELDVGNQVVMFASCIGHTRNNMVQEDYKKALEDYYGDKLEVTYVAGVCSYHYTYKLKEITNGKTNNS